MDFLRNAAVPAAMLGKLGGDLERLDIGIEGGRIASLASPAPGPGRQMDGGLVLPAFVDIHTHLDKGHIWPRKQNPDGTWIGALLSVQTDREGRWSAEDVRRRMDFALRCAYAHGTAAIRTHIDAIPPQHAITWDLFAEVREQWADRIELQAVSLFGPDLLVDKQALDEVARKTKEHGGLLGGSVAVFDQSKQAMLAAVDTAGEYGLDLDLHTDETGDPSSHALEHLADGR